MRATSPERAVAARLATAMGHFKTKNMEISFAGIEELRYIVRSMRDLLKEPLRHASNLCGPFNLCSLLSAVSLGPLEGATTHDGPTALTKK